MVQELKKSLAIYFSKEVSETNESILDMVNKLCEKEIEPYAREMDQIGAKMDNGLVKLPEQMYNIVKQFGQNDLFGLAAPELYEGSNLSHALQNAVIDRVAQADASASIYISLQTALIDYINRNGTLEAKQNYLPGLAKGNRLAGFLYSESQSGSDLGSVQTTAERNGDHYVVNGSKIWISNAGVADTFSFLASTDPSKGSRGLTAFILDTKNQPGYKVLRLEKKLGINASPTGQVSFDNVEIPIENRLGEENRGFSTILYGLASSRIGIGAQACGIAEAAYQKALHYINERKQFGKRIIDFQSTQFKIADMISKIKLARNYYLYASRLKDQATNYENFSQESSIAKLFASEMAQEVTYEAVQLLGGYGYVRDYDVERYSRDARITTIYEGTSEIQRLIISREEMN